MTNETVETKKTFLNKQRQNKELWEFQLKNPFVKCKKLIGMCVLGVSAFESTD